MKFSNANIQNIQKKNLKSWGNPQSSAILDPRPRELRKLLSLDLKRAAFVARVIVYGDVNWRIVRAPFSVICPSEKLSDQKTMKAMGWGL